MKKNTTRPENKRGWKRYREMWSCSLNKKQVGFVKPKVSCRAALWPEGAERPPGGRSCGTQYDAARA